MDSLVLNVCATPQRSSANVRISSFQWPLTGRPSGGFGSIRDLGPSVSVRPSSDGRARRMNFPIAVIQPDDKLACVLRRDGGVKCSATKTRRRASRAAFVGSTSYRRNLGYHTTQRQLRSSSGNANSPPAVNSFASSPFNKLGRPVDRIGCLTVGSEAIQTDPSE